MSTIKNNDYQIISFDGEYPQRDVVYLNTFGYENNFGNGSSWKNDVETTQNNLTNWIVENVPKKNIDTWGTFQIIRTDENGYRNGNLFFWDGKKAVLPGFNQDIDEYGYIPSNFLAFKDYDPSTVFEDDGVSHNTYFFTQLPSIDSEDAISKVSYTTDGIELAEKSKFIDFSFVFNDNTYHLISWKYYNDVSKFIDIISKVKCYFLEFENPRLEEFLSEVIPNIDNNFSDETELFTLFEQTGYQEEDYFFFLHEEEIYLGQLYNEVMNLS